MSKKGGKKSRMKGGYVWIVILACLLYMGCGGLKVMSGEDSPQFESKGLVNGYFACNGIRPYNGTIVEAGALGASNRWGDIASVDGWPIGGFGVSFIGCRIKLLACEAGLGMLGYHPEPEDYPIKKEKGLPPGQQEQPQEKDKSYLYVDRQLHTTGR
jgi:hypothetical protein